MRAYLANAALLAVVGLSIVVVPVVKDRPGLALAGWALCAFVMFAVITLDRKDPP